MRGDKKEAKAPQPRRMDALGQLDFALKNHVAMQNQSMTAVKACLDAVAKERQTILGHLAIMIERAGGSMVITKGEMESLDPKTQVKMEQTIIGMQFTITKGGVAKTMQ